MTAQLRSVPKPGGGPTHPRLLLKLADAAAVLSISRSKLYGLLRTDALPSVVLGGQRYVAQADLDAFVDQLREEAGPYCAVESTTP